MNYPGSTEYLNKPQRLPPPNKRVVIAPTKYLTLEEFRIQLQSYLRQYATTEALNNIKIPTNTSQLINDSNFLTQHQSLVNYVTKDYLKQQLKTIDFSLYKTVEQLPEVGLLNKIYLVKSKGSANNDLYAEYIYNGDSNTWEKLGEQTLSLLDYAKLEQVSALSSRIDNLESTATQNLQSIIQTINNNYNQLSDTISETSREIYQAYNKAIEERFETLFDTDGTFTGKINPVAIKTTAIDIGSTSGNFQLQQVIFTPNANLSKSYIGLVKYNQFCVECGNNAKLIHYGIKDTYVSFDLSSQDVSWYNNGELTEEPIDDIPYYLYAVCDTTHNIGYFILDTKQWKYNEDTVTDENGYPNGLLHFMVGVLSSVQVLSQDAETDNDKYGRLLNTTYGLTTIDGQLIKTGIISSIDGKTYFDLTKGEIGGKILFTLTEEQKQDILKDVVTNDQLAIIQQQLSEDIDTALNNFNKYDYLLEVLEASASGNTEIIGGLVLSNTIMMKDANGSVTAGINGITQTIEGQVQAPISAWFGGQMIDRFATIPTDEIFGDANNPGHLGELNGANSVFRSDGSGYLAGGNIVWDEKGKLWANIQTLNVSNNGTSFAFEFDEDGYLILPKTKVKGTLLASQDVVACAVLDDYTAMTIEQYIRDYINKSNLTDIVTDINSAKDTALSQITSAKNEAMNTIRYYQYAFATSTNKQDGKWIRLWTFTFPTNTYCWYGGSFYLNAAYLGADLMHIHWGCRVGATPSLSTLYADCRGNNARTNKIVFSLEDRVLSCYVLIEGTDYFGGTLVFVGQVTKGQGGSLNTYTYDNIAQGTLSATASLPSTIKSYNVKV